MRTYAKVLVDESHRQAWSIRPEVAARISPANPSDSGYTQAALTLLTRGFDVAAIDTGPLIADTLADCDVLVLPHCSTDEWEATNGVGTPVYTDAEQQVIVDYVLAGGGLVILAEEEQAKYGNSLADIAAQFGVRIENTHVQDPHQRFNNVSGWVLAQPAAHPAWDVWAGVQQACWYRGGTLTTAADTPYEVAVVAHTSDTAAPAHAGLLALARAGAGRVVVVTDSDLFGDDSIDDLDHRTLWRNLVTWAAVGQAQRLTQHRASAPQASAAVQASAATQAASAQAASTPQASAQAASTPQASSAAPQASAQASGAATADPAWQRLTTAVEQLRPLQAKDGSVAAAQHDSAAQAVTEMTTAIGALAGYFPHQREQLTATVADLHRWANTGFATPDFLDSLMLFHPEQARTDGIEHLAVFPMYTQNGNPARNIEAVVIRTVWPQWIADIEAGGYDNAAFVPIEFVGFTAGYDTHSAVLFPETVAVREVPKFTWGGIFCDREAARYRVVTRAAAGITRLALPPDAEMLLDDQHLAQETFILWDLVHDRFHSHGDLPFDPFMIKQRMPYWMYALEELRCDLSTYRETALLETKGVTLAPNVRFAILFDRLFRFPTSGTRVRNYDGLGGQILFAWLHKHGVLNWTDNTLSIDWLAVDAAVVDLAAAIDALYREGIDRSRLGHWLAAHEFVASLVPPHPGSVWAQGPQALPTEPREAVNAVLDDEFPLSVFYEALRKKLKPVIDSTVGITGQTLMATDHVG